MGAPRARPPGMTDVSTADRAAFYRAALLLGLVPGERVVRWADDVIAHRESPKAAFIDISTIPPGDVTSMRHALFRLGGEPESQAVLRAVLGLISHHLAIGRRSVADTMTVLGRSEERRVGK